MAVQQLCYRLRGERNFLDVNQDSYIEVKCQNWRDGLYQSPVLLPDRPKAGEEAEVAEQRAAMIDEMVQQVSEMIKTSSADSPLEHIVVHCSDETDGHWWSRICERLQDSSVHANALVLQCSTELSLPLLTSKIAQCSQVQLRLYDRLQSVEATHFDLDMLRALAQQLSTQRCQQVWMTGFEHLADPRLLQPIRAALRALLSPGVAFSCLCIRHAMLPAFDATLCELLPLTSIKHLNVAVTSGIASMPLQELTGSYHCEITQMYGSLAKLLKAVRTQLTRLELNVRIGYHEKRLQSLLQSLNVMTQLRELHLTVRLQDDACMGATAPARPMVVQLLKLGTAQPPLYLDDLHLRISKRLVELDVEAFGAPQVQSQTLGVLSEWKSVVSASLLILIGGGQFEPVSATLGSDVNFSTYPLCRRNQRAITDELQGLLHLHNITEQHIGKQILCYTHKEYHSKSAG